MLDATHHAIVKGQQSGGGKKIYFACKEVIVVGCAFNTPKILNFRGSGPKAELEEFDIDVKADVPGVGENLKDKLEVTVNYAMTEDWLATKFGCKFVQKGDETDPCYQDWRIGETEDLQPILSTPLTTFIVMMRNALMFCRRRMDKEQTC